MLVSPPRFAWWAGHPITASNTACPLEKRERERAGPNREGEGGKRKERGTTEGNEIEGIWGGGERKGRKLFQSVPGADR